MGKNLLILGAFVSVLMLASCTGGRKETVTYTPEEIADAGQVMKYYDTSLALSHIYFFYLVLITVC